MKRTCLMTITNTNELIHVSSIGRFIPSKDNNIQPKIIQLIKNL